LGLFVVKMLTRSSSRWWSNCKHVV